MSDRVVDSLTKYVSEDLTIGVQFQPILDATGSSITSVSVEAERADDRTDVVSTLVPGGATQAGSIVNVTIEDGIFGLVYLVTVFVTLADGDTWGHRVQVAVR